MINVLIFLWICALKKYHWKHEILNTILEESFLIYTVFRQSLGSVDNISYCSSGVCKLHKWMKEQIMKRWYIKFIFCNIMFQENCTYNAYFTQLILIRLSVTPKPLKCGNVKIHYIPQISLWFVLLRPSWAPWPAPVSRFMSVNISLK